ncbi:MAG: hypothetical protein DSY75_04520 [Alteromonas sp.]|nr:MAG: hypothetical protein DSY75_04520 [Alteromonas sp.]
MKEYVVYFNSINSSLNEPFDYTYAVEADSEDAAKKIAVSLFLQENPEEQLDKYVYGFEKN